MRKLAVVTMVSLDGIMQAPGGPEEDPTGGFELGGWTFGYADEEITRRIVESEPYELLLGRGTYEIFAAYWPYAEGPIVDRFNAARKHVASRTLERADWSNSVLVEGDVAEYVAARKREDGPELQVHGSAGLVQTLLEHDLVDELRLSIFPLVLGRGKRLFGEGAIPAALKLVESRVSKTGVVIAVYERAGEVEPGSFAAEEPSAAEVERRRRLAASAS